MSRAIEFAGGVLLLATACGGTRDATDLPSEAGIAPLQASAPRVVVGDDSTTSTSDGGPTVGASVLFMHNHINRDGFFVDKAITHASAPSFALTSYKSTFTGQVYASPLYVEKGPKGKGTFYVATETNTVYAIDEATGAIVWQKTVAKPATSTGARCDGNIAPNGALGITGTPAIDLDSRLIVFSAVTADASGAIGTHTIFALGLDDGHVKWRINVNKLSDGSGLEFGSIAQAQNQRAAVLIVGGIAYVAYGGHYGDCPLTSGTYYHGWVVGVPLTGTGAKAFATQVAGAAIWGPGGPSSDGQSIFVTTGNGKNDLQTWSESEGLFRLDPGPSFTGQPADYFAPYNWMSLDADDLDISGSGPLVIDPASFTPSQLVLGQGKDGYLYLVDRTNLGGVATSTQLANVGALQVSSGQISNAGAWANIGSTTYIVVRPNGQQNGVNCPNGTAGDLVGVKLDATAPEKMSVVWCAVSGGRGEPFITTSNGRKDPIVWTFGAEGGNLLTGIDLPTGQIIATGGTALPAGIVRHFTSPIVVHGKIYAAGDGQLYQFAP